MNLHEKFTQLGRQRNRLTNELLAILPEIFQQGIYKKYCATIEEYAGKFAGLSASVVKKRLRLEKTLIDKPTLRETIKTQGVHKVALVAKLATPENEKILAEKVSNMSKNALFEMAKELRHKEQTGEEKCQAIQKMSIELDEEMQTLFLELKKEVGNHLSNKEALRQLLRKLKSFSSKKFSRENFPKNPAKPITRHIPAALKREVITKTANKCAYPGCNKPYHSLHHRLRFADQPNHHTIVPTCKAHHEFFHNSLIQSELASPEEWQLQLTPTTAQTDLLYQKYRRR